FEERVPRRAAPFPSPALCVVLAPSENPNFTRLLDGLAARLEADRWSVVVARPGPGFTKIDERRYVVPPTQDGITRLFREAGARAPVAAAVFGWTQMVGDAARGPEARTRDARRWAYDGLAWAARALATSSGPARRRLLILTADL